MGKGKVMVASFQSLSANSGQGMARLGYYLSEELHKRELLYKFVVHSKGKYQTNFPCVPVSAFSRFYLLVLNKLNRLMGFQAHKFRFLQERLYDNLCSQHINEEIDLLFVTFPFLKKTLAKAKRLGIKTVLLSGTPEENYIYNIVVPENKKMGITTVDAYTYPERLKYFNESIKHIDVVVGSLPPAYTSYKNTKAFDGKLIQLTGHMPPDFKPATIAEKDNNQQKFVVGYLAYTVVLKGLQYLLEAWAEIVKQPENAHLELHIGGGMDAQTKAYIDKHYSHLKQVTFLGHIADVGSFYKELDLFVVPSLIDGAPVTALEAAHYEVPVLITENSGSAELLGRGNSGCMIIPIKNAAIIAEKILWADRHRTEAIQMGKNGKKNLEANNFPLFIKQVADELEKEMVS